MGRNLTIPVRARRGDLWAMWVDVYPHPDSETQTRLATVLSLLLSHAFKTLHISVWSHFLLLKIRFLHVAGRCRPADPVLSFAIENDNGSFSLNLNLKKNPGRNNLLALLGPSDHL